MKIDYKIYKNILPTEIYNILVQSKITVIPGGYSNELLLLEHRNIKYTLRLPYEDSLIKLDRNLEHSILDLIKNSGIIQKTIYYDPKYGIKLSEFIEGEVKSKFSEDDILEVAKNLGILHSYKGKKDFDINSLIVQTEKLVKKEHSEFLLIIQKYLKENEPKNVKKVLCHNDIYSQNMIFSDKLYFIDFEFAGNNDPLYDIACFAEADLELGLNLLKKYKNIEENDIKNFYYYRIKLNYLWYLFATYKEENGFSKKMNTDFQEIADFFETYSKRIWEIIKNSNI